MDCVCTAYVSRELEGLHNKFLVQAREKMKARGDSQVPRKIVRVVDTASRACQILSTTQ